MPRLREQDEASSHIFSKNGTQIPTPEQKEIKNIKKTFRQSEIENEIKKSRELLLRKPPSSPSLVRKFRCNTLDLKKYYKFQSE